MEASRCKIAQAGAKLRQHIEAADANNSEDLCRLVMVANFLDSLGLMVMEGLLNCRMCYDLFGRVEEHYYEAYRSILEDPKYKNYFKYFSRLHGAFQTEAGRSKEKPHTAT
jgi:hypothetical protein